MHKVTNDDSKTDYLIGHFAGATEKKRSELVSWVPGGWAGKKAPISNPEKACPSLSTFTGIADGGTEG